MRAAGRHTAPPVIHKRVRRPPPDPDSTSQAQQPPPAMRPAHLVGPATAVRPSCRPSPYRPNRCRTAQAVLTRSKRLFHGPAAPPQPKGAEGCNRKSPQPHPAGLRVAGSATGKPASDRTQPEGPVAVSNRGRGGKGLRKGGVQSEGPQPYPAGTRRESDRVFRRLCTICKPKYTF